MGDGFGGLGGALGGSSEYAVQSNKRFPGTQTKATAEEVKAAALMNDRLPAGVTFNISGQIKPAT